MPALAAASDFSWSDGVCDSTSRSVRRTWYDSNIVHDSSNSWERDGWRARGGWARKGNDDWSHWADDKWQAPSKRLRDGSWSSSGWSEQQWHDAAKWSPSDCGVDSHNGSNNKKVVDEDDEELEQPWYVDTHDLVLEPTPPETHLFTLLMLHSCTGGPDDFLPFFHRLKMSFRNQIKAVIPCAPLRTEDHYGWPREINSWFEYDCTSGDGNAVKHQDQLVDQRNRILGMIERERQLLPGGDARRLVLWGLSQGAGLAVDAALHSSCSIGGVIALRGMALQEGLENLPSRSADLELFAFNGGRDWICPPNEAKASYEALQPYGIRVEFDTDPALAHGCARGKQHLCQRELDGVASFLRRVWRDLQ
eukprot:TRINITY_DN17565_c0_g1_i1.p1 TRINITY_DN17565_c0_g1~~TRINITY_DN17565_c0_g1_i1.p1  ORF type:complete len:364 (+),score=46.18 TRINITY_DN17565_c0_g1_i1:80-1171(+)